MASSTRPAPSARQGEEPRRTYVLDTSVLLSDPRAILRFAEHEVVIPVVVVVELEAKRSHPELGYFARTALRLLDDLRIAAGRLDAPVPIGEEGGTLRIELNHTDAASLPAGFRLGDNDTRILAVARNLANEGRLVTIVSKDLPMRLKAGALGIAAEEYRNEIDPTAEGGPAWPSSRSPSRRWTTSTSTADSRASPRPSSPATPGSPCSHRAGRPWAGSARTSRCAWCAVTATRSACTVAVPSSGSPWTC